MSGSRPRYFDSMFDDYWVEDPSTGCWNWTFRLNSRGYGTFPRRSGSFLAHRISYERKFGPIPQGLCVCHRCDNPICVNPDHLFLGTQADNLRDMRAKGRGRAPGLRGEQIGNAKLNETKVKAIKALLRDGVTQCDIASRFGVTQAAISTIKTGLRWRHVEC